MKYIVWQDKEKLSGKTKEKGNRSRNIEIGNWNVGLYAFVLLTNAFPISSRERLHIQLVNSFHFSPISNFQFPISSRERLRKFNKFWMPDQVRHDGFVWMLDQVRHDGFFWGCEFIKVVV
ncbi:MAG: hypothetical protein U9P80_08580 [Thermodesulfobacteriota bacterium]|nr:hypothetical protein [Thermodesulfobacteriota bacterium]